MLMVEVWKWLMLFLAMVFVVVLFCTVGRIVHLPRCWGRWKFVQYVGTRSPLYVSYEVYRCTRCGAEIEEYE